MLLETGVAVFLNEPIELPPSTGEDLPVYKLTTGDVIQPDITLVATGRTPNSDELGLECVDLTRGAWISVNELCRRRLNRSMLLVRSTAFALLDSVATAQANVGVENILGRPARFDKRWFSRFLHTQPPIASIGWTEQQAKKEGMQVESIFWSGALFTDDDFSTIERDHMAINATSPNLSAFWDAQQSHAAEIINLVSTAIATSQSARTIANSRPCIRAPQKLSSESCKTILRAPPFV